MRPQPAAGVNSHFDDGDMRAKAQMQLAGKALRDECKNPQFLALEYRPRGPMDKASAYGAGDCRFESYQGQALLRHNGLLSVSPSSQITSADVSGNFNNMVCNRPWF